ncbi:branched-chain amino acid ABC transporter permease [Streptomyces sp. NPDC050625]|uniref:branched-chain amino acid ABC transporter permease n=1 Tax=Streptomyces sp. NPDC050625 TaxID=3154629 RepID=UPI0034304DB3
MDTFVLLTVAGLSIGALYYLLASGLSIIFGLLDVLSFAHGALVTVGAYAAIETMAHLGTPSVPGFLLAVLAATAVGGLVAYVIERLLVRPMYSRGHLAQLLVTMGAALIMAALIESVKGPDEVHMPLPKALDNSIHIFGAVIPISMVLTILAAIGLHGGLLLFLARTRHGLIVRAGVDNADMVRGLGIDVSRSFSLVFVLGGLAAGLGGALAAVYVRAATPSLGDTYLVYAFIVLIIGGLGSLRGAFVAAAIAGVIQQFANYYVKAGAGDIVVLALLVVVLLLRPQGLFGRVGRSV